MMGYRVVTSSAIITGYTRYCVLYTKYIKPQYQISWGRQMTTRCAHFPVEACYYLNYYLSDCLKVIFSVNKKI